MLPLAQCISVKAQPPSLRDNTADLDRLKKALLDKLAGRMPVVPLSRLSIIAGEFRRAKFNGTAVVNNLPTGPEIVDFLTEAPVYLPGMALDLGTTHLEANLVDLISGRLLASADRENSQIKYGADILSRIHFAAKSDGLEKMHREIVHCINLLGRDLAEQIHVQTSDIRALSVSGNTTMAHFFLKLDPYWLCREPYIPLANAPDPCKASDLGLEFHPGAPVWVLPSVGSYFGGDLISGILASGMDEQEKTCMLIDVGTNAEVILGNRDWLIACAGAAGPALEGGVARMGMRAGPGAIEHVEIDPQTRKVHYQTIGNQPPEGICGSGIIDLVAGLYLAQVIDMRGKFRHGSAPEQLVREGDEYAFVVAPSEESAKGKPVVLSQVDLDALMRSKAAMYAILTTLTNQVGVGFDQLQRIYVAGAFGQHINPRQAVILGMLPDLSPDIYEPVGNSSLAGAKQILLDQNARSRCLRLVKKITYMELNVNQEFMIRFSGSRFIPHTDHSLFPSVPFFGET